MSNPTEKPMVGKFRLISSENSDDFLKELSCGFFFRKLANVFTPTIEMGSDENGNFVVKAQTWAKSLESHFKLGEEFDEDRFDGKKCKSVVVIEDNKFIQTQNDGIMEVKYIREFEEDKRKVTAIANNVKCFRVYQRIEN